jgi:putative solute:sodium symporter small subunit
MPTPGDPLPTSRSWAWNLRLIALLLLVWGGVTFVVPYFAQDLRFKMGGWPFSFWMVAQGALLVYLVIVALYGWLLNRRDAQQTEAGHD